MCGTSAPAAPDRASPARARTRCESATRASTGNARRCVPRRRSPDSSPGIVRLSPQFPQRQKYARARPRARSLYFVLQRQRKRKRKSNATHWHPTLSFLRRILGLSLGLRPPIFFWRVYFASDEIDLGSRVLEPIWGSQGVPMRSFRSREQSTATRREARVMGRPRAAPRPVHPMGATAQSSNGRAIARKCLRLMTTSESVFHH